MVPKHREQLFGNDGNFGSRQSPKIGAAPHLPAGIFSPYSNGEKGARPDDFANRQRCRKRRQRRGKPLLPVTIRGGEAWSAQRTKSQLLGFSSNERRHGDEGQRRLGRLATCGKSSAARALDAYSAAS
ncbi:hypothetical protein FJ548_19365 [Mesorhizobium sp. B2-4-17]|nr:hypothetical protein FJ548_19365 [Mesorhizobium sp. B2-4-17]